MKSRRLLLTIPAVSLFSINTYWLYFSVGINCHRSLGFNAAVGMGTGATTVLVLLFLEGGCSGPCCLLLVGRATQVAECLSCKEDL